MFAQHCHHSASKKQVRSQPKHCQCLQCRVDAVDATGAVEFKDKFQAVSRFCSWNGTATGTVDLGFGNTQDVEFASTDTCQLSDCMVWCMEMTDATIDSCRTHCTCMDCIMPAFQMTTVAHPEHGTTADETGASTAFTNAMSICYDHPRFCPAETFSCEDICNHFPGSTTSMCAQKCKTVTDVQDSCSSCIVDAFNQEDKNYNDFGLFMGLSGDVELGDCLNYDYLKGGAPSAAPTRCASTEICPVWALELASDDVIVSRNSLGHVEAGNTTINDCPLIGCRQSCKAARVLIHGENGNITGTTDDTTCEEYILYQKSISLKL